MSAATSAGSMRRSIGCWAAKALGAGKLVQAGALGEDRGVGGAGADAVGGDAASAQLGGEAADQADHAGLGSAAGGEHRQPTGGGGRRHGDQPAVTRGGPLQHDGDGGARDADDGFEVDVQHRAQLCGRHLPQRYASGDHASADDDGVEAAVAPGRLIQDGADRGLVGRAGERTGDNRRVRCSSARGCDGVFEVLGTGKRVAAAGA
jgi:hypothetical protein